MKRYSILMLLSLSLVAPACNSRQEKKAEKRAADEKHTVMDDWAESLDDRDFSSDAEEFRQDVKEFGDDVKATIEEYTPEVENLMQSVGDYLER